MRGLGIILLCAWLTILSPAAGAQGTDGNAPPRRIYFDGEQLELTLQTDRLAVRFEDGLSLPQMEAVRNRHPLLAGSERVETLPMPPVQIFVLGEPLDDGDLLTRCHALKEDAAIRTATPVYRWGGIDLIPTEGLFVQLRLGSDEEALLPLMAAYGLEVVRKTPWREGNYLLRLSGDAPGDVIAVCEQLLAHDEIESCQPNFIRRLKKYSAPGDPRFGAQWGLHNVGQVIGNIMDADLDAPEGWEITEGDPNVVVAIIDEGCDMSHPDYAVKLVGGWDFCYGDNDPSPTPWDGHGTACAGIAAALALNEGIAGVDWWASIMPIRIAYSPAPGGGWVTTDQWLSDGIAWAHVHGAAVLSNSWGGGPPSAQIRSAIRDAVLNGRGGLGSVVAFATGNDDANVVSYPAAHPEAMAVGATSPCDERKSPTSCDGEAWGSNYGLGLDVAAPGVLIPTTDIQGSGGYNDSTGVAGDYYMTFNGTSAATPHVAGLASLLISKYPHYLGTEIRTRIQQTCDKVGGYGYDATTGISYELGYGRINIYRALSGKPQVVLLPADLPHNPSVYRDDSDAENPYPRTHHDSAAYEWLGWEFSPEANADDPEDPDGRPNVPRHDGFDAGLSFYPPYIPGQFNEIAVRVSVENSQSSRYQIAPLFLNVWFDWDSDGDWESPEEWMIDGYIIEPATWAAGYNSHVYVITIDVPGDEIDWHVQNARDSSFLNVRARLTYETSLPDEHTSAEWGEVEDYRFLNFVEMFDERVQMGYMDTSANHCSAWVWMDGDDLSSCHPPFLSDAPSNDHVDACWERPGWNADGYAGLRTPPFDLEELTDVYVQFEYSAWEMPTGRVRLLENGVPVDTLATYINDDLFCSEVLTDSLDFSSWCGPGHGLFAIEFQTYFGEPCGGFNMPQEWKIDNVMVIGVDNLPPASTPVDVTPVSDHTTCLEWTAPSDDAMIDNRLAEVYNIRYGPEAIDDSNWRHSLWVSVDMVGALLIPGPPYSLETLCVNQLSSGQHHFCVCTQDEVTLMSNPLDWGENQPPVITAPDSVVVLADESVTFTVDAIDPDFDRVVLFADQLPTGAEFTDDGNGLGTFVWTPDGGDIGDHTVMFCAQDWNGATAQVSTVVSVVVSQEILPPHGERITCTRLLPSRPTPFHERAQLSFELERGGFVQLDIYDVGGRLVRRLLAEYRPAGRHDLEWNGRDEQGNQLETGVYFLRLDTPEGHQHREIVMLR